MVHEILRAILQFFATSNLQTVNSENFPCNHINVQIYVYGVLEFDKEKETRLGANNIVVVGGKIVLGWADEGEHLTKKATILLTGSRSDSEYTMNDGTNVGSKVLIMHLSTSNPSIAVVYHRINV